MVDTLRFVHPTKLAIKRRVDKAQRVHRSPDPPLATIPHFQYIF